MRRIIVELDFVTSDGGPVVARTLTHFRYVGILTGARHEMSVSLNRRPLNNRSTLIRRIRSMSPGVGSLGPEVWHLESVAQHAIQQRAPRHSRIHVNEGFKSKMTTMENKWL